MDDEITSQPVVNLYLSSTLTQINTHTDTKDAYASIFPHTCSKIELIVNVTPCLAARARGSTSKLTFGTCVLCDNTELFFSFL